MPDPPLVLVDARMARRRSSGVATYVRELRAAIDRAHPADLRVKWLLGPPGLPQRNRLTSIGNLLIDLAWTHLWVPLVAWRTRAAVIHSTFNWAPWRAPCPTVVTLHDLSWEIHPDDYPADFRAYARLFTRRSVRTAHIVITPSAATAHDAHDIYRVPSTRLRAIPHGVHHDPGPGGPREPFVLSVGVLHRRKRVVELVKGHRRYWDAAPEGSRHRLVVVGGPAGEEDAVAAAAGPGCDLRGFVTREELIDLYRRAALLAYPSQYEGFGMPVAEAMAHGCPVLVARNSSLVEVAGDSGIPLEDPTPDGIARALADALADPQALRERGEKARKDAERFSWRAAAAQHLDAYRAAARSRR